MNNPITPAWHGSITCGGVHLLMSRQPAKLWSRSCHAHPVRNFSKHYNTLSDLWRGPLRQSIAKASCLIHPVCNLLRPRNTRSGRLPDADALHQERSDRSSTSRKREAYHAHEDRTPGHPLWPTLNVNAKPEIERGPDSVLHGSGRKAQRNRRCYIP